MIRRRLGGSIQGATTRLGGAAGSAAAFDWFGYAGRRECVPYEAASGVRAGTPVTLDGLPSETTATARVLRPEWNMAGLTLTVRVFRRNGQTRTLVTQGTVASGTTTVKGVSNPTPAMPMIATPGLSAGDYEVEIETDGLLRCGATLEG